MHMQQGVKITVYFGFRRLSRTLYLALSLLVLFCGAMQQAVPADLDKKIAGICAVAKQARETGDFETVERKRRERWDLIVAAADDPSLAESPWVIGYRAIRDVDGDAYLTAEELPDPGLLNRMDYKGACQRLREALEAIMKPGEGPFLGEVATRLFEVAQQARACYRNALVDDSHDSVATLVELEAALRAAEERDPCCVMATPMRLFIKAPDPREAFLRAELRDDFKSRQRQLVKLSHRMVLAENANSPAEHADDPLLPWHAAVELCKAQSLGYILEELDHASYLTPEQRGRSYVLPGKVVAGTDALSDPFVLLYGRYLIARVVDEQGRLRTAQLFLNDKNQWEHRFLDLLWRTPKGDSRTPTDRLIEELPPRATFTLHDEAFSIREFPVDATDRLIGQQVQIFCVRDVSEFEKLKYVIGANDPKAVYKLESLPVKQAYVTTTPQVKNRLAEFTRDGDRTKHPLIELMRDESAASNQNSPVINPLIIVSDSGHETVSPAFFPNDGGDPYLMLNDGVPLYFDSAGESDRAPCFYVDYPGATAVMPLQLTSVPLNLMEAGAMGSAFKQLLLDAGYAEAEADLELRRCIDKPTYVPPKFKKVWIAKIASTGQPAGVALEAMLKEKGWTGAGLLASEVRRLYDVYGFRYLRDRRGNWITSSRFSRDQGNPADGQGGILPPDVEADIMQYPFDFRGQDGKQRVDRRQVYAWQDYQQLKQNISREHLAKLIRFHPCFPVWDSVMQDAMHRLENPSEKKPDYSEAGALERYFSLRAMPSHQGSLAAQGLKSPCGTWAQPDDRHQRATLDNLHNEHVLRINAAAEESRKVEGFVILYEWLNSTEERVPGVPEAFANLRKQLDEFFNSSRESWMTSVQPVFAVQLESARDFAAQKYFHRAMVHYNDLLLQQYGARYQQEGQEIVRGVATTEDAEKYAKAFGAHIEAERLALVAQLELAGVLNAAGLKDSAYSIWRRLADEYRYVLKPMVAIAEDTVMAYGLRFSDRATDSLRAFDDIATRAEAAIEKYQLAPKWRTVVDAEGPGKQRSDLLVSEVETLSIKEQSGEPLAPEERRALDAAMRSIGSQGLPDLASWLRYRKALLPRLSLATRPLREYRLHPIQFSPQTYSRERGFERSIGDLLTRADIDAIRRWSQFDEPAARKVPLAPEACFLLGWYWLDAGQSSRARAAFMAMVDAFQSQAQNAAGKQESLVAQLNAMSGVVGAMSIAENVPGLAVSKGDFGVFLRGQVLRWEREWFAAALYGPHAKVAGRAVERQVDYVRNRLLVVDAAWRSDRYYFPDYTYVFGAVPDWLAKKAILTPELFDASLTKEDVADKKGRAAQELDWVLLTEGHAKHFYDNLKVDLAVKQDIVDLAK